MRRFTRVLGSVQERHEFVAVLELLLLLQFVLGFGGFDGGEFDDFGKELRIDRILVTEIEVNVALSHESVKQPILLPLFKQLRALKGDDKPAQEFANLSEGARDDFKGRTERR